MYAVSAFTGICLSASVMQQLSIYFGCHYAFDCVNVGFSCEELEANVPVDVHN